MDYNEAKKNIYDNIGTGVLIPIANDDMLAYLLLKKRLLVMTKQQNLFGAI